MLERRDFLFPQRSAGGDRAVAEVLQHGAAAQFSGVSAAGAGDVGSGMIFPSPAQSFLKPLRTGVQALSMNSLRSAWTPILAGLKRFHYAGEGKIRSLSRRVILSVGLVQNTGQVRWPPRLSQSYPPSRKYLTIN